MITIDASTIDRLSNAHRLVRAAEVRFEHRKGMGRTRQQLVEARQAEFDLLDRLGFASYGEFLLASREVV